MRGQQVTWPQFTSDNQMVLTFDTQMSSESADNVTDWIAMADFWVAIDALAQWADVDGRWRAVVTSRVFWCCLLLYARMRT